MGTLQTSKGSGIASLSSLGALIKPDVPGNQADLELRSSCEAHLSGNRMPLEVEMPEKKLRFPAGLPDWIGSIKEKIQSRIFSNLNVSTAGVDSYLECVEIEELPGAFICCSFYQVDMNDVFTRVGLYMGAGKNIPKGTIVPQNDHVLNNYKKLVAGHNLPGPLVTGFWNAAQKVDGGKSLNSKEHAFFSAFLNARSVQEKGERFYLIGFAIQNIVSHEIFHAQYFLNDQYRRTVREFWAHDISDGDKQLVIQILGKV